MHSSRMRSIRSLTIPHSVWGVCHVSCKHLTSKKAFQYAHSSRGWGMGVSTPPDQAHPPRTRDHPGSRSLPGPGTHPPARTRDLFPETRQPPQDQAATPPGPGIPREQNDRPVQIYDVALKFVRER